MTRGAAVEIVEDALWLLQFTDYSPLEGLIFLCRAIIYLQSRETSAIGIFPGGDSTLL